MGNLLKASFITILFTTAIASCSKLCDEGYEGKRCDVEIRGSFIGAWNVTDNPGNIAYTDTISRGTGILDVLILRRFGADTFNRSVKATISGNTINIARQKPESLRLLEIEGTGTISNDGNTINWNYDLINTSTVPEDTSSYTGIWVK